MSWSRERRNVGSLTGALAALVVLVLAVPGLAPGVARASTAPPPMVTSPLDFSASSTIDTLTPFAHPFDLRFLSCPTSSLCVAMDNAENILTTTDPTAPIGSWSSFRTDMANPGDGLSCPSASFCIATGPDPADTGEQAIYSTDPAGGPSTWHSYELPGGMLDQQLDCPNANFCAAINGGTIYTSTDPAGGTSSWQSSSFSTNGDGGIALACASASLCVIGNSSDPGPIWSSTDPSGGPSAWKQFTGMAIGHISCPTEKLCVASGIGNNANEVAVSTNPNGGASAWSTETFSAPMTVTCRSTSFCVGLQGNDSVVTTRDPTGGLGAWSAAATQIPAAAPWETAASCPTDDFCAAALSYGNVAVSSDPAGAAGSWQAYDVDGYNFPTGVSCPSDGLCVAVDDAGNVLTSTQPENPGPWSAQHVDSAPLMDVSCLAGPLCVAVDASGGLLTSTDPAGGSGAWTRVTIDGTWPLRHVSCASGPVCVAIDEAGDAFTSVDPLGGAGAWQERKVVDTTNNNDTLTDVACAERTLCLISAADELWVVHDPGQADVSWQSITPGAPNEYATPYPSVSCSSASFCAVLSAFGLYYSTDPGGGVGTWSGAGDISSVNESSVIRCQSQTLCLAINDTALFESATPTVNQDSWWVAFDDEDAPTYVGPIAASCPSSQFCMVVGDAGYGWSGEGPDYVPPPAASAGAGPPASVSGRPGGGSTPTGTPPAVAAAAAATAPAISAADRELLASRIELRTGAATIRRARPILRLRLACVSAGPGCAGAVALSSGRLRLGRFSYRLAAGRSRTLVVRLGAGVVALLGRSHRHRAAVSARLTNGQQTRVARLMLSLDANH
jgi:hypothetical protein